MRVPEYYRKLTRSLIESITGLLVTYDEDSVHKMRIAYKKMRAVNKFVRKRSGQKKFRNEYFDRFDQIYKNAGRIRESHVNFKLITKYAKTLETSYDDFSVYLDQGCSAVNSSMQKLISDIDVVSINKEENEKYDRLTEIPQNTLYSNGIRFIKSKSCKIDSLLFEGDEKGKYHSIRTNVKETVFFLKLFFSRKESKKLDFDPIQLDKIGIRLGEWHDREILLEKLKTYFKAGHITNFRTPGSRYYKLLTRIDSDQVRALKRFDHRIAVVNLELSRFIGLKRLELM